MIFIKVPNQAKPMYSIKIRMIVNLGEEAGDKRLEEEGTGGFCSAHNVPFLDLGSDYTHIRFLITN